MLRLPSKNTSEQQEKPSFTVSASVAAVDRPEFRTLGVLVVADVCCTWDCRCSSLQRHN
jgi:hypothetical protein